MDPAEDIDELNNNIDGQIKLVNVFYGYDYRGLTPESTIFEDKNPTQQFVIWKEILDYNSMDFYCEIKEFWKYIFMNYSYWKKTDFIDYGITLKMKFEVLLTMKEYWKDHFPQTELIEGNT